MVSVARESLINEKFKVSLSVFGVVLSIFLILILFGITSGLGYLVELPIRETDADLWITSEDSFGSLHSPSLLPLNLKDSIEQVEGIKEVQPLIRIPVTKKIGNTEYLLYIMGYNVTNEIGKPWKVIKGNVDLKNSQIVIDKSFAKKTGLRIGDQLEIKEKSFEIVGINDDSNMLIAFMVFMTFENSRLFLPTNLTSFFVIKLSDGIQPLTVKSRLLSEISGISVHSSDDIARQYRHELLDGFVPILTVLGLIGLFVGIIVIGMTIYSLTIEKTREYGILKAIGASDAYLYRVVLIQSLLIALIGLLISFLLIPPITTLIQELVPEFAVKISLELLIQVSLMSLSIAFLASLIPVRKLMAIDPVIVFKQ